MCVQVIIILIRSDLFSYFTLLKGFKRQDIFNLCIAGVSGDAASILCVNGRLIQI